MRFPKWVEHDRMTYEARARNRLRYILSYLALQTDPRGSLIALAEHIGVDKSTLSYHVLDGACTERTAMLIVSKLGDSFVKAHELTNPLGIRTEAA